MKRTGNLWPLICARENIEKAANDALSGKRLSRNERRFVENRAALLDQLEDSLKNETYRFGRYHSFTVYEPKERRIDHPDMYPDKILHNCVMNVIAPVLYDKFTADTYGSIKGRGIKRAADKLKPALRDNPEAYYVQLDVRKYYQSIDHDVLKGLLRRVIKCAPTLRMLDAIIDSFSPGLAIGVWPNQCFANLMLTPVDHWAKEVAHIPHYFRYMDDILFIAPDKTTAHRWLAEITTKINALKLEVKNNVRVAPVSCGIDLTNDLESSALVIANLYKNRWSVELFFKWIKQHLKIKKFWGTSENAVRIQIYCAIITYCLVAIMQHDMRLERSVYEVLQILGISLTDKTHIRDLFDKKNINDVKVLYGSSEPNLFNF